MELYDLGDFPMDSHIDGAHRALKNDVVFKLFRIYKRKVVWSPFALKNGGIFYNDNIQQKEAFIELMAKQSQKISNSVDIHYFDLYKTPHQQYKIWDDLYNPFHYHHYTKGIQDIAKNLVLLRQNIRIQSQSQGYVEPPNRKINIVLLDLDEKSMQVMKNNKFSTLMTNLLTQSLNERLFVFLICPDATELSREILDIIDWGIFMGEKNALLCRKVLYPGLTDGFYSINQETIGIFHTKIFQRLFAVYPLKFTPSEFYIRQQQEFDKQNEIYNKYLATLNDGTHKTEVEK